MKRSAYLSLGLLGLVTVWMLSGALASAPGPEKVSAATPAVQPMTVQVAELRQGQVTREVVVQGQLEPRRRVQVRAETSGRVVDLPVEKGSRVTAGMVLIGLAREDRPAQLAKAEAEVASRLLDVQAARKLQAQGLQAVNQLKSTEAALAAARAERERLELDLARTRITAPFDGIVETRPVEQGSLVERGDTVAEIVDISVLKAVGQAPQQSAGKLALGQSVKVRLLDGREARGRITYLARVAESGTRSFRVEAEVPNGEGKLDAGISAELRIAVAREPAHFLSPAVLTLDDQGRVGVKAVNAENRVDFHPVSLVRTAADGVWVSGLPEKIRVITQGQGFVAPGQAVEPVSGA